MDKGSRGRSSKVPRMCCWWTKKWVAAKWGVSANNRKARFYTLTAKGRKQLIAEQSQWRVLAEAIGRILGPEEG
jgi:PadR family transcriptional regulator PadR